MGLRNRNGSELSSAAAYVWLECTCPLWIWTPVVILLFLCYYSSIKGPDTCIIKQSGDVLLRAMQSYNSRIGPGRICWQIKLITNMMSWHSFNQILHKMLPINTINICPWKHAQILHILPCNGVIYWTDKQDLPPSGTRHWPISPNLVKPRSSEIGCYKYCTTLKFDRHLGSNAVQFNSIFQLNSKYTSLFPNT